MKALIGLPMLAGAYHSNRLNLADAWSADGTGMQVFRLTTSLDRFRFLICCLRFDNKSTWDEGRRGISLPHLSKYLRCSYKIANTYIPSEYMTKDKMFVGFGASVLLNNIYPVSLQNMESKFMHCVMLKLFMYGRWKFMSKRNLKDHTRLTSNTIITGCGHKTYL